MHEVPLEVESPAQPGTGGVIDASRHLSGSCRFRYSLPKAAQVPEESVPLRGLGSFREGHPHHAISYCLSPEGGPVPQGGPAGSEMDSAAHEALQLVHQIDGVQ